MKKYLSFLLVLALIFGTCALSACDLFDESEEPAPEQSTTESTTTTSNKKPIPDEDPCNHEFGDWIVVSQATFDEIGLQKRICSLCGKLEWAEVPLLKEDVTLWVSTTSGVKETVEALIEKFIDENPEYFIYRVNVKTVGEGDAASEVIQHPENAPDMFCFAQDYLQVLVSNGVLSALDEEHANAVINGNGAGSVGASSFDGTVYAYPYTADNGFFLYYDSRYITDEEAKTLEGIIAACEESGKKFGFELSSAWYGVSSFFMAQSVKDNTPLCVSKWTFDNKGRNPISFEDTLNSDNGLIAMKGMQLLTKSDVWFDSSMSFTNTAAVVSGIWDYNSAKKAYGEYLRAAKLPTFTIDGNTYQLGSYAGYKMMGVVPQEDANKEAFLHDLAAYLTGEESQTKMYSEFQWGPSNKNVQQSEAVQSNVVLAALLAQNTYAQPQGIIPMDWWTDAATLINSITYATSDDDLKAALTVYENAINSYVE